MHARVPIPGWSWRTRGGRTSFEHPVILHRLSTLWASISQRRVLLVFLAHERGHACADEHTPSSQEKLVGREFPRPVKKEATAKVSKPSVSRALNSSRDKQSRDRSQHDTDYPLRCAFIQTVSLQQLITRYQQVCVMTQRKQRAWKVHYLTTQQEQTNMEGAR